MNCATYRFELDGVEIEVKFGELGVVTQGGAFSDTRT